MKRKKNKKSKKNKKKKREKRLRQSSSTMSGFQTLDEEVEGCLTGAGDAKGVTVAVQDDDSEEEAGVSEFEQLRMLEEYRQKLGNEIELGNVGTDYDSKIHEDGAC